MAYQLGDGEAYSLTCAKGSMRKALVTGCLGFVAGRLIQMLQQSGVEVRGIDLRIPTEPVTYEYMQGNITHIDKVVRACEGVDTVFHVTAVAVGPTALLESVNVRGTEIVLEACKKQGVKRVIYTCTASVVFNGLDLYDATEDMPYVDLDDYGRTKGIAEAMILKAGKDGQLMTASIRPHTIYGPGDTLSWPRMMNAGKDGGLKYCLGSGKEICSFTYVDNLCHGEILAANQLESFDSPICGEAFNVNDNANGKLWEYIYTVATLSGVPRSALGRFNIPYFLMKHVAQFNKFFNIPSNINPQWLATIATSHTFSTAKATKILGYKPIVPHEEGIRRTRAYFQDWLIKNPIKVKKRPALSYWLIFVALLSTVGWVQAFAGYLGSTQFSLKPEEATGLAGRLFGAWTLIAGFVRLMCGMDLQNKKLYYATFLTFMVAGGIYYYEFFVSQSIPLNRAWPPFVVASLSMAWMAFFPPRK